MASAVAPTETHEDTLPVVVPATAQTLAGVVTREGDLNQRISALTIVDQDGLALASTLLNDIRGLRKEVLKDLIIRCKTNI